MTDLLSSFQKASKGRGGEGPAKRYVTGIEDAEGKTTKAGALFVLIDHSRNALNVDVEGLVSKLLYETLKGNKALPKGFERYEPLLK